MTARRALRSRPLVDTQETILRIRHPQRVKASPQAQLDNLQSPKTSEGPAIIQIAEFGFPEAVPSKDFPQPSSGIHPVRDGERVFAF